MMMLYMPWVRRTLVHRLIGVGREEDEEKKKQQQKKRKRIDHRLEGKVFVGGIILQVCFSFFD